ncbi:MAG: T9SS type A sorting domain-containing protein [Flavobacteriales bacterium]|nr:T9SS type A sorting domain-containing protein [Flavobacteriales bacterium]
MRWLVVPAFLVGFCGLGQNWALLNPAYKYNYSDDGSDTINAQIFVTHVDTLGPDSFRYALNRIATVCDTCSASGLFLLLDQPQFLQRMALVGPTVWHFQGPGSMVVLPQSSIGTSWLFDTLAGVTATVVLVDTVQLFGMDVERKRVELSNGGSITLSPDHGILTWNEHALVGVHGPEVGILVPRLEAMFPYGSNDVVEYATGTAQTDGVSSEFGQRRLYKFTIDTGAVDDGQMVFDGTMIDHRYAWSSSWLGGTTNTYGHQDILGTTWTAGRPELPWADLLLSYPGQVIGHRSELLGDSLICIAHHGRDGSGRYTLGCRTVQDQWNQSGHFMAIVVEPAPGDPLQCMIRDHCDGGAVDTCGVLYTAGIGLNWSRGNYFEANEEYLLVGSVVDCDTIGTVHPDDDILTLSVGTADRPAPALFPNPAADRLMLTNAPVGRHARLLDRTGKVLLERFIRSAAESIDVRHLSVGLYLMIVEGMRPQPVVIAR